MTLHLSGMGWRDGIYEQCQMDAFGATIEKHGFPANAPVSFALIALWNSYGDWSQVEAVLTKLFDAENAGKIYRDALRDKEKMEGMYAEMGQEIAAIESKPKVPDDALEFVREVTIKREGRIERQLVLAGTETAGSVSV